MCVTSAAATGMKVKMKMKMKKAAVSPPLAVALPVTATELRKKAKLGGVIPAERKSVKRMMFKRLMGCMASAVNVDG
ncbi:hypothetical protein MLD38_000345 [Melastoma candidum]|uniref:Uncharacterized protein n=1 Tax=Melastoma candidum TaxID=119954 RepID=A0ACB9SEP8_9MYRT|nr:hypothetical protein MLD38_000345 [Melastoma candidum]